MGDQGGARRTDEDGEVPVADLLDALDLPRRWWRAGWITWTPSSRATAARGVTAASAA